MDLKFFTSEAKGLKLKIKKFYGVVSTFLEVAAEKLDSTKQNHFISFGTIQRD